MNKKLFFILLIAFLLRVLFLGAESLWIDEGVSLYQSGKSFSHLILQVQEDVHVPLYPLLLFSWIQFFGDSIVSIRFLSVVFGVLSSLLVYVIGKKIYDEKAAFLASLFFSLSPVAIFYAQEARVYSFLVFLVLLSTFFMLRFLQGKKHSLSFIVATNTLILYTHVYGALFIAMQSLYILSCKKFSSKWLAAQIITGLLFSPWLFILAKQLLFSQRNLGWIDVLNGYVLGEYLIHFIGSFVVLGIFIAAYLLDVLEKSKRSHKKIDWFSLSFIMPLCVVILVGFFLPVFHERYVLFTLPFIYLFFATKIKKIPVIFTYLVIAILLATSLHQGMTLQKDDWKSISKDIVEFNRTVLVHPYYHQEVLSYYIDRDCFYSADVYGCMAKNHSIISLHDEEPYCHKDANVSNHWPLEFYNPIMLVDVRSHIYDEIPCNDYFEKKYMLLSTKTYDEITWWKYKK